MAAQQRIPAPNRPARPRGAPPGARVVATVALCLALPVPGGEAAPRSARPLGGPVDSAPLARVYQLAVVDLPAPPAGPTPSQRAEPERHCPVEVRAIVQGDSHATTFTVIAWGEHSKLLSAGEGVKTRDGWLAVSKIVKDHVILRRGDVAHRCELNSAASGRQHRTR